MGLFDKLKPKVHVRMVGKVSSAHLNRFTLKGEVRKDERFEKARWTAISISASQLERCIFDDVHSELRVNWPLSWNRRHRIRNRLNPSNECSSYIIPMNKSSNYCACPDITS